MTDAQLIDHGANIDKDWLYNKYVIQQKNAYEIGDMINRSSATVYYYLNKYDISIRSLSESHTLKNNRFLAKDELYNLYIIKKLSAYNIATQFNTTPKTITNWLHYYNIPVRDLSECKRGSLSHRWKGGISTGKYCYKFNNVFKEHIREKFNRTCYICGKSEENLDKKLSIHHIDYNKSSICNGKEFAFIPLCASCHAKTNGNRWYWFNLLINYWLDKYEISWVM